MKRKSLFLLVALTISATLLSGCKSADSVENSETAETTAVESGATEETEVITETVEEDAAETYQTNMEEVNNKMFGLDDITTSEDETESVEEYTETTEIREETTEVAETTNIKNGEPLSEKDLAFSFLGYDTYNEYVEAGNAGAAYILADNANMIVSGEFTDDGDVLENTVRGIKLGDSIDKVFELYGNTEYHSTDIKDVFSHDGLNDSGAYSYFLKIDSTKKYFYAFRFRIDQNNNIIAVVIEPIPIKYWSEN